MSYLLLYLKYKSKYLQLKKQLGGTKQNIDISKIIITTPIKQALLLPEIIACRNEDESEEAYRARINSFRLEDNGSTAPLKFNLKLESINSFIEMMNKHEESDENKKPTINLCTFINCYSKNPEDPKDETCNALGLNDEGEENDIEPIKVKQVGETYTIIDGRHRVVANIVKNKKQINAEIVSDDDEPCTKRRQ